MPRFNWMLAAAIACALSACSSPQDQQSPASTPQAASSAAPASSTATTAPAAASSVAMPNPAYVDHSVRPGDDFFDYANGAWLKSATIPADRSGTGTFLEVFKLAEQRTAELI